MNELSNRQYGDFIALLKEIIASARQKAYSAVNFAQIEANWLIGQRIVEQEQHGNKRAEYGKHVIKLASEELTYEFGKGFSERTLRQFRQFYIMFPEIMDSANSVRQISGDTFHFLTWSHIQRIMRVENQQAREWYLKETAENMWDFRTLDRNISTLYYQRLLSSQIKEPVIEEMKNKTADFQRDTFSFIKNPTVLDFLGLPNNAGYTESTLEQAIINQMQKFLLELGKGFAFVDRQQLIRTETQDFYIDLVFYNYILKCFVIIELKTEKMTHQDIGQLDTASMPLLLKRKRRLLDKIKIKIC